MSHCALAVSRGPRHKYVQFAADDGLFPPLLFDLDADPEQRHNLLVEGGPDAVAAMAWRATEELVQWHMRSAERTQRQAFSMPSGAWSRPGRRLALGRGAAGPTSPEAVCDAGPRFVTRRVAPLSDMNGKTVVVTGGNSGIGFETAAELASMGARVLVTRAQR